MKGTPGAMRACTSGCPTPGRSVVVGYLPCRGGCPTQVRDRWVQRIVERPLAIEDEGFDERAPSGVPPGVGSASVKADVAVPPRLQRTRTTVLGSGGDPNARALTRPGPTSTLDARARRNKMAEADKGRHARRRECSRMTPAGPGRACRRTVFDHEPPSADHRLDRCCVFARADVLRRIVPRDADALVLE